MRRGERWFLLPRLVGGGAVIYAGLLGLEVGLRWVMGIPQGARPRQPLPSYHVLPFIAALYGFGRVLLFHPFANTGYAKWLATAPWRPGMPLPLGPVHLVGRDLLVLVPLALLAQFASGGSWLIPPLVFGVCYLLPLWLAFWGRGWWAYALAWGIAGLLAAAGHPPVFAALVVVMHIVARVGLRHSLPRPELKVADKPTAAGLGAPFELLAPVPPPAPIPLAHSAAYALLAGWWAYCVIGFAWPDVRRDEVVMFTLLFGVSTAFIRWCAYAFGAESPLGLRGRWVTGRWFLPGYDRILVAPGVVLIAGTALPVALAQTHVPPALLAAACGAVVLLLALALPPTRADWRLTGHHHLPRRSGGGQVRVAKTA
jgi:hypothetical protein